MKISAAERVGNYVILVLFAAFALYPLIGVFIGSLDREGTEAPGGLANYAAAFEVGHFGTYLLNSLLVSALVVAVATGLSILAAYAFGTMTFPLRGLLFYVFLLGIMVPSGGFIVPLHFGLRAMRLADTLWAVAFPQIAQTIAFGTFWLRTHFRQSSRAIVEAARIDGASPWQTLWLILVPLARPAIVTLVVLTFLWTWNEFLIPLIMLPSNEGLRTAPLGLGFFQGQYTSGYALLAAGAVIIALPVVAVHLVLQRHVISGMTEGAVKS